MEERKRLELTNYEKWFIESRCQNLSDGQRCQQERELRVVPGGEITMLKIPGVKTLLPLRESELAPLCYYHRMKKEGSFKDAEQKRFGDRVFKTSYQPPV